MDNLLTGKTRKEASRMFFETLVSSLLSFKFYRLTRFLNYVPLNGSLNIFTNKETCFKSFEMYDFDKARLSYRKIYCFSGSQNEGLHPCRAGKTL